MATFQSEPGHVVLSATRARQGRYGRHVLWVLLISTALAALGMFAAWTWRASDLASTEQHNGGQPADAQTFDMGAPVAQQVPSSPTTATKP